MATTYKKARDSLILADNDLKNFLLGIAMYATDHAADPDFYPHYADLEPLIPLFADNYDDYMGKKLNEGEKSSSFQATIEPLRQLMIGLRRLIPSLFKDDLLLDDFGLSETIPSDVDKILTKAHICNIFWASLHTPDAPPEYLPIAAKLDSVAVLTTALETAQAVYAAAIRAREDAQNLKDVSRTNVLREERGMFSWYRGLYTDPQDEFWTATPWGKSSGGGSSEPLPAPEGVGYDVPSRTGSFDEVIGAVGYTAQVSENLETYDWTEIYKGQDLSFVYDPGVGSWFFRVRAYTDIVGVWSDLVEVVIAQ